MQVSALGHSIAPWKKTSSRCTMPDQWSNLCVAHLYNCRSLRETALVIVATPHTIRSFHTRRQKETEKLPYTNEMTMKHH